jgi:hypothetical protein
MHEFSTEYVESMIADGYRLRTGQTVASAVADITAQYQTMLAEDIARVMEEAKAKAIRDFADSLDYYTAELNPNTVLWDGSEYPTEAEYDAGREAELVELKARTEAHNAALDAAMAHAMEAIPAAMVAGTHYRFNAPQIVDVLPGKGDNESVRTLAIGKLIRNGTLVKIDRTANTPPYLTLA